MQPTWGARDIAPAAVAILLIPAMTRAVQWRIGADRGLDWIGIGLLVVAGVALLWRRRAPLVALGIIAAAITAYLWFGYAPGPPLLAFVLAVYSVAVHRPLRTSIPAAGLAGLALLSHVLDGVAQLSGPGPAIGAAWVVVAFTVGVSVRTWRESRTRERDEVLRRHLDAERLHLSRDVHDVVGHGLAAINMQAKVALRSVDRDDAHSRARVRESLTAITASSGAALDELRAVLARIPADGGHAPVRPSLGLGDIPALADRLAPAGLRVIITEKGESLPLPAAAELAGYRVAQEALTNALRHGDVSTAVEVLIEHVPGAVSLEVSNRIGVRSEASLDGGMGIPGMQDRVAAAGGTLQIDPGPHRFVVRATLPQEAK